MAKLNLEKLRQRNIGLLQLNAVKTLVIQLKENGYTYRSIYEALQEQGAYSGSYRRFCEYVQQECINDKSENIVPISFEESVEAEQAAEETAPGDFIFTPLTAVNDLT